MSVFDLFSKRQKKLKGEMPDIYIYDSISPKLKVQIIHIIRDTIGEEVDTHSVAFESYKFIHETLCREYGKFTLLQYSQTNFQAIYDYFLKIDDIEQLLDILELSFKVINTFIRKNYNDQIFAHYKVKMKPNDAIDELNIRFKEEGFGYQFDSNELIKIDSTLIHTEITRPVLKFLNNKIYSGANEEFLKAHEHYRHGRNKECLNECLKAFESVMKTICNKNKWNFNQGDTSRNLIDVCFKNNLIPVFLQNQFTSLRSLLESGIPTIRNKLGGHGQGDKTINVDDYITNYALNLTASNIYLLIKAEKEL